MGKVTHMLYHTTEWRDARSSRRVWEGTDNTHQAW